MKPSRQPPSAVAASMFCAGLVAAQFVAGKAVRDAIYLTNLDVASLPHIVVATSIVSIVLVVASSKGFGRFSPAALVPGAFAASALLFVAEWMMSSVAPVASARVIYLHVSGLGPMLGSGFWLIATERFDPHTAKRRFSQITGAGTAGGLLGALLADRIGAAIDVWAMLPVLAAASLVCSWQIWRLARPLELLDRMPANEYSNDLAPENAGYGLRVLGSTPYLRHLAALVLLGSVGAALADYVFKVQAVTTLGRGETLLRFFAIYYAATSAITFAVQLSSSRFALEKLGIAVAASTPSFALLAGGVGGLFAPGLPGVTLARGGESVFRGSLFRAGYEVFYTPVASREKRAAKSIIDVGFDRLGDALGGGTVRLAQLLPYAQQYGVILSLAIGCSILALVVASRLSRGYVRTLERSLLNRAVELDLSEVEDTITRSVMLQTFRDRSSVIRAQRNVGVSPVPTVPSVLAGSDPELHDILELRSRDRDRIRRVLRHAEGLPPALVPHVVTLLAWEPVADDAVFALRKVAEERVGELVDALIDPNQPFAVRRRLARVFSVCVSQRAADGLILGLDDLRFEVRFQCGRSLAAVLEKNPRLRIDAKTVFEVIQREVAVSQPVWESRQLLDRLDDPEQRSFVDEFVQDRASQSLAHVFTLLSLVLPAEPLRTAFRALHTNDQRLRGTALEYLEGVLPQDLRQRLWPFLEDKRIRGAAQRSREEILEDLLRSNQSIMMNLEELKRRAAQSRTDQPQEQGELARSRNT